MTYALAAARLAALSATHSVDLAEEAMLFGALASAPGHGARLVVEADDPRLDDPALQRILDGAERSLSSDLDYRDTEPCPPPDDDDDPDDFTEACERR